MSYRIPGAHPTQKPTRSAQIDGRHPLSAQLVGAWLIPDLLHTGHDSVDAWHDRIANGVDDNYARIEGTNSFSVGPRGTVLNFVAGATPGSAAYLVNAPGLNYSSRMSLFVRARIPALGTWRWLVSKVGGSWLGVNPSNKLSFTLAAGTDKLGSVTVGDGLWHTVGMTLDGTTLKLWVDGALDTSFAGVVLSVTSADTFWGHNGSWAEFFNGDFEWVNQWKRPLSDAEVADLHANPFGIYQTDRLSRYYLSLRNPAATGARVTQLAAEVAYPGALPPNRTRVTQEAAEVAYLPHPVDKLTPYGSASASGVFTLLYTPGMPTGPTWSAAYNPTFGQPAVETFTYDDTNAVAAAAFLIEDTDGILPSGNVTADLTPSLAWNSLNQSGLQAYYQFEPVPGFRADSGPNGWDLSVTQGAVAARAGAGHGGAWALQTSLSSQATLTRTIGAVAALNGPALSVEGWFLWKGTNAAGSSVLPFYGAADGEYLPRLLIQNSFGTTTLQVQLFTLASGVTTVALVTGLPQDSAWHHAAMTYDAGAGQCAVYYDGSLALSLIVPAASIAVAAGSGSRIELDLGDYALDEAALYSTILSPAAVAAHFQVAGGPFLYRWTLRAGTDRVSGAVVASGTVFDRTSVQIRPAQRPGPYTFELSARDVTGASGATSLYGFVLIDARTLKALRLISLPAFDVAPVVPDPPDYLRYLPQWLACFGTAAQPPSGSLLYRVMVPVIRQLQGAATAGQELLDGAGLESAPRNQPRLAWHLRTTLRPEDAVTLLVQASGDVRPVRRAASLKQFLEADDPVVLVGETGHVVFRNLAQRQVTLSPVSGSTGATGSVLALLSSQYQIPFEGAGMVPDANVLFQSAAGTPGGGAWYRIRGGSAAVDPAYAAIQLSPSFSGSVTFQYQSETYASALQVAVSGQPWRTPGALDLWNRFDELALLADMRRRSGEDNLSLALRLTVRLLTPPGTDLRATAMAIAADLQLVDLLAWDGQSILDLAGSGYIGVRGVTVPGLLATDHQVDRLVANGPRRWTGAKRDWLPGWQVLVDGRPAGSASYPGMTVSGNTLDFGTPVSGVVTAHYQYANYRFDFSVQQAVTRVVPTSGNVPSGDYRVLLAQGVQLSQPADPDVQKRKLLNGDGTPNPLFFLLQQALLTESPIHLARARWGGDAYWVPPAVDQPLVDHLPTLFDKFTP